MAAYAVLWSVDFGPGVPRLQPWDVWTDASAPAALRNMAEVTVGVLGAAITVVSIIVELASSRYTPRITEVFLRDRTNLAALSSFVIASVLVLWIDFALGAEGPPPRAMIFAAELMMSGALLGLLPYFAYVLTFLSPDQLVTRLALQIDARLAGVRPQLVRRASVVRKVDQIGDIALKSVENRDRSIATAAIEAMDHVLGSLLDARSGLDDAWFDVHDLLVHDADFVAFDPVVIDDIVARRTWLEMKILLQLEGVFRAAIGDARETAHLVAIVLRRTAVRAAQQRAGGASVDPEVLALAIRFLNTCMRAALNHGDVRTAYNVLHEYRQLAQGLIGTPAQGQLPAIAERMRIYGQIAFRAQMPFVLETVAYDLCMILEHAWKAGAPEVEAMLRTMLDVDREPEGSAVQEAALRGVRKAQVKLATAWLAAGDDALARRIQQDMQKEDPARLASIRAELEQPRERMFWEVSDRGVDFDWLEPERQAKLMVFFAWFEPVR